MMMRYHNMGFFYLFITKGLPGGKWEKGLGYEIIPLLICMIKYENFDRE